MVLFSTNNSATKGSYFRNGEMAACAATAASFIPQSINIKWNGKEYKISGLSDAATVRDLKKAISAETGVLPERQKLMGLKHAGSFLTLLVHNRLLLKHDFERRNEVEK